MSEEQPETLSFGMKPDKSAAGLSSAHPVATKVVTRRRALAVGAAIAVACTVAGGLAGYRIGAGHVRTSVAQVPAEVVSSKCTGTGATVSTVSRALNALLLPRPQGATRNSKLQQGPLSFDAYLAELFPHRPDERTRLMARCFQGAACSDWIMPDGVVVVTWLVQFRMAADARSDTLSIETADADALVNTVAAIVPGFGDGAYIANPSLDRYGNTYAHLLADRRNVMIIMHVHVPARLDKPLAIKYLKAQYARL